jgi:hypothetical protein
MENPDTATNPGRSSQWLFNALVLLACLALAAALIHVNVQTHRIGDSSPSGWNNLYSAGWPFLNRQTVGYWKLKDVVNAGYFSFNAPLFMADIFICAILLASTIYVLRTRLAQIWRSRQFTLADLFALTTVTAVLFSLFAAEKSYGWSDPSRMMETANYSALSAHPLWDLIPISFGILCFAYLSVTALMRILRKMGKVFRG